ncbi:MAG: histidine ammonia-lyase [Phycisphaerae bacterium]|nr:histidine ammonia-lyase [Phycisphaerae bacterium]
MTHPLPLTTAPLTPTDVHAVAHGAPVALTDQARAAIEASRAALETAADDNEPHYGVNTGFGSFSRQRITQSKLRDLQRNLVRSHASGLGDPLPDDVVRATMLLLAASLSRGHSGVRVVVVERLIDMLNAGVTPSVPEVGSVGASGDLAPLAHIALVLIGEGEARVNGKTIPGAEAMRAAGLEPVELEAKEGLALINGTHLMAARFALLWMRFERLFPAACLAAAMSLDACRGTDASLDPRVYVARNQPGPAAIAARLRELLIGSEIVPSHANADDPRVQDPYSIRCAPIVLGAALDMATHCRRSLEAELGAVTDNPLVFGGDGTGRPAQIISAGNFHGMPVAIPLDVMAICLSHVAGISERRTYHMISAFDPDAGLRPYLSPEPGLHSGYMIPQYAAAACCNELVGLAAPASVSNIPTSAGMEDYNSFGPRSAAKADRALSLATSVIAIELLCAAQAIEAHRPLRSGHRIETAHATIRAVVPALQADRPPAPDIKAIERLITDGAFDEQMVNIDDH